MVGQVLGRSTKAIVENLGTEDYLNNKYRVNAIGYMLPSFILIRKSICLVAKDLNLFTPEEVLKSYNKQL